MGLIESHDLGEFQGYLKSTHNTICGERPIQLLLALINHTKKSCDKEFETQFVKYEQSEPVKAFEDSSVSYASSFTTMQI
mmetsp:Transcript_7456/g.12607  ORF Transcript_7456/g.12607 Transcript_7456/m.12607 type:complete len:80 (-) Transcript_7456:71-310(-)